MVIFVAESYATIARKFLRANWQLTAANELGRRLDYTITNGRYQGTTNAIGFDGLWTSPDGHAIILNKN
jgi:hypothetical protein